jgi:hypothetical protein
VTYEFSDECANQMRYTPGRGAPPKYCGQVVDGRKHTTLNAYP